jgi:hypothetical protein
LEHFVLFVGHGKIEKSLSKEERKTWETFFFLISCHPHKKKIFGRHSPGFQTPTDRAAKLMNDKEDG